MRRALREEQAQQRARLLARRRALRTKKLQDLERRGASREEVARAQQVGSFVDRLVQHAEAWRAPNARPSREAGRRCLTGKADRSKG